ncbi:hypothetical protein TNCV_4562281 [Trichonephila clavipes]|nr:hypothetical protein TNCV_4562281 [Trichonephila clavipes]
MACYRQTGIRANTAAVSRTLLVARSRCCKAVESIQETGNVRRRPGKVGHAPLHQLMTGIQLTAYRNRTENATQLQRQLLLAAGRGGCPAKQYVIGFMRGGFICT